MLDFRLKTFLTLCKAMNYTKTAEILHITQPAVSQHIKYLEEDYGVRLFNFKGKTLELTKEGETLYNFALSMANNADKVKTTLALAKDIDPPLNFGATLTIGEYTLSAPLKDLMREFPNIRINMEVGNTETLLRKLRDGEIDFAILEGHFDKSSYESIFFSSQDYIGVSSPKHRYANKKINFDHILGERLILRERGSGTRDILERILYEQNYTMKNFQRIVEIGNMNLIKDLVVENFGITFLYKEAVKEELKKGTLVKLDLVDFNIQREFNFVYLKNSLYYVDYIRWFDFFKSKKID